MEREMHPPLENEAETMEIAEKAANQPGLDGGHMVEKENIRSKETQEDRDEKILKARKNIFQKMGKGFMNFMTSTIPGTPEKAQQKIQEHRPTREFYDTLDEFKKSKLIEYFAQDLNAGTPAWSSEKNKFVDKSTITTSITH